MHTCVALAVYTILVVDFHDVASETGFDIERRGDLGCHRWPGTAAKELHYPHHNADQILHENVQNPSGHAAEAYQKSATNSLIRLLASLPGTFANQQHDHLRPQQFADMV